MTIEQLTEKDTGRRIDPDQLRAAGTGPAVELTRMLTAAAHYRQHTEQHLLHCAEALERTAARIRENIHAAVGQPIQHLNPMGELPSTGARVDQFTAQRADRIEHLCALAWLVHHHTADQERVRADEPPPSPTPRTPHERTSPQ
jgi:hypothetical protein